MNNIQEIFVPGDWKDTISYKHPAFDLAEDLLYFLVYFPAVSFYLTSYGRQMTACLWAFVILAAEIAMTMNRRYAKKNWVFHVRLVLFTGLLLLVPFPAGIRIFIDVSVLVLLVCSLLKHRKDWTLMGMRANREIVQVDRFAGGGVLAASVFVNLFVYLFSLGQNAAGMIVLCFFDFTACAVVYYSYVQLSGSYAHREWERSNDSSAAGAYSSSVLFAIAIAGCLLVIGFILYTIVSLTGIDAVDKALTSFVKGLVNSNGSTPKDNAIRLPADQKMNGPANLLGFKGWFNLDFVGVLLKVFICLVAAGGVLLLLMMLPKLIRNFIWYLKGNDSEQASSVFSVKAAAAEVKEKIKKIADFSGMIFGASNREKIRKYYYKTVKKYKSQGMDIRSSDSPGEIMSKIEGRGTRGIGPLTQLYEKARYSGQECTPEDVDSSRRYSADNKK